MKIFFPTGPMITLNKINQNFPGMLLYIKRVFLFQYNILLMGPFKPHILKTCEEIILLSAW